MKRYLVIPLVFALMIVPCILYAVNGHDEYDIEVETTREQFEASNSVIQEVELGINKSLVVRLYQSPDVEYGWQISDPGDQGVVANIEKYNHTWTFLTLDKGQSEIRFVHGPPDGQQGQTYIFRLIITVV